MADDTAPTRRPASGRFVLRIDPALHASLREAARASDTSLNRYCARKLASPSTVLDGVAAAIVRRAALVLGSSLLGVVAFGSCIRGDHSAASDLDVLLVAGDDVDISRELYRRWDDAPELSWHGYPVAPHFVHLVPDSEPVSGFWAEVALDGLVLFDQRFEVSRQLSELRRRILAGETSRRVVLGQSYWVREGV